MIRTAAAWALLVALLLTAMPAPAPAQWAVIDIANLATAIEQLIELILAYVQRYQDYLLQIEHYTTMVQQLDSMLQDLESFDDLSLPGAVEMLADLQRILDQLDAVLYSEDFLLLHWAEAYSTAPTPELQDAYTLRADQTLESLRGLLLAAQHVSSQPSGSLGLLESRLEGAAGNLQALQAVGSLTAYTAGEVQRSVELSAATTNALAVAAAYRIANESQAVNSYRSWLAGARRGSRPYPQSDPLPDLPRGFDR